MIIFWVAEKLIKSGSDKAEKLASDQRHKEHEEDLAQAKRDTEALRLRVDNHDVRFATGDSKLQQLEETMKEVRDDVKTLLNRPHS